MNTLNLTKTPTNDRIRGIALQSAINLVDLLTEHEDALQTLLCESDEGAVTVAHSLKIDIAKNQQNDKLSFSLKTADEIVGELRDPNQPELDIEEGGES